MNLTRAIASNAPSLLEEIDHRIDALLRELRELHHRRTELAMYLSIAGKEDA